MASRRTYPQHDVPDDVDDLLSRRFEVEKERVRLRDERGELNRVIRQQARADTFLDMVRQAISESVKPEGSVV